MTICEMERLLKTQISPGRYSHTLGVVKTALELSELYGLDRKKTHIAALLHDAAKSMDTGDMVEMARAEGFEPDVYELQAPPVLHAPAGAAVAAKVYGIKDIKILNAIRRHTIGDEHMTKLDAVLYVADFIEPGRKPFNGFQEARTLAYTDLLAALKKCAQLSCDYVERAGGKPHPITQKMILNTEDLI